MSAACDPTKLSAGCDRRLPWLFVIARNSSFTYNGRAVDVKQAARELGVRYVLEGSVRKAGELGGQLRRSALRSGR